MLACQEKDEVGGRFRTRKDCLVLIFSDVVDVVVVVFFFLVIYNSVVVYYF